MRDSSGADVTAFLDESSVSSARRPVPDDGEGDGVVHHLFAFPAEDNFAGGCWRGCWKAPLLCADAPLADGRGVGLGKTLAWGASLW